MASTNAELDLPHVDPESILTPLQSRALTSLFRDYRELQAFCLTGGTALAGFYFGHRRSIDLDLFTIDPEALTTSTSGVRWRRLRSHNQLQAGHRSPWQTR